MSATYLGGMSIGAAIPVLPLMLSNVSNLLAPQSAKIADIEARLALPFTPPNPIAAATALQAAIANLATSLASMPAADARMRLELAAQLASLSSMISGVQQLVAKVGGAISTGGFHAFSLDNAAGQLGADLATATTSGFPGGGGPLARSRALVLATESPTAWAALGAVANTG